MVGIFQLEMIAVLHLIFRGLLLITPTLVLVMISLLGSGDLLLDDQYFLVCDNLLLTHLRFFHSVLLISRPLPTHRFLLLVQSGILLVRVSDNKIDSGSRPLCLNDRHFFFFSPSGGVLRSFLSLSLAIISPTAYPVI